MKILILFTLLVTQLLAALTVEDLKKTFLTKADLGPMSYEKLVELEDALREINREDIIEKLMNKLDRYELSFLSSIIHVCELEGDTLGTYQRGQSKTSMQTLEHDDDINDLRIFWDRADILDVINRVYKYQVINNGVYASLVIMEWPVICIRPGYMLANNLATFAHEVEHFLGDEEKSFDITHYENEQDYVIKNFYRSGGEFDAYQAGAMLYHNLKEQIGYKTNQSYMKFFDSQGIIIDPAGLEKMVLDEMEYREGYISYYRSQVVESYNDKVEELNRLRDWFELYEKNLSINISNKEIFQNNIKAYENNINYYEYYNRPDKVQEMKDKIDQAKIDIEDASKAILFYTNIIELKAASLDNAQKEMSFVQDLLFQLRRSTISTSNLD